MDGNTFTRIFFIGLSRNVLKSFKFYCRDWNRSEVRRLERIKLTCIGKDGIGLERSGKNCKKKWLEKDRFGQNWIIEN